MSRSRTINVILNSAANLLMQVSGYIVNFIARTVLIYTLGAQYLGINGLFSNILSLLAMSELGIGTAVTFYLYRPLNENDQEEILSIMRFFKNAYTKIGGFILVAGCCFMPFLPRIVNFEQNIPENLYLIYFLFLLDSASSYLFFNYKQTLLTASQRKYVLAGVNVTFSVVNAGLCSIVLLIFRQYIVYLVVRIALQFVLRCVINLKIDKEFPYLKRIDEARPIGEKSSQEISKSIRSIFFFRLAANLYESTDNIIISATIGTIYVGYYSNYLLIAQMVTVLYDSIMSSFAAGIGNLVSENDIDKTRKVYYQLEILNTSLVAFCCVCMLQLYTPFMRLWLARKDEAFILEFGVVCMVVCSFFIANRLKIIFLFKDAFGLFQYGKYRQLAGGIVNIVLSVILAQKIGLLGILMATNISNILFSVSAFAKSVFQRGLHLSLPRFYLRFFADAGYTVLIFCVVHELCELSNLQGIGGLILQATICLLVTPLFLLVKYCRNPHFEELRKRFEAILRKH